MIFELTQVHFSFLTEFEHNTAKHSSSHKEDSLFFVKVMLMSPLMTAVASDDVAQEIQMPIDPQALEDVEEPMLSRPVSLKDPGNS